MKKISFEDALILNAVRTARFLLGLLPLGAALAAGRGIGSAVYFFSKRRRIIRKNLRAAFAGEKSPRELRAIARGSVQNLVMAAVEVLRFPEMDARYLEEHVRITGIEKFENALAKGRGIIFLTGHFGNWELLSVLSGLKGYPLAALARSQKHPRSDEYLNRLRTSKGTRVIRKGMPVREILRALEAGQIVGMVGDQDAGRTGTFVRFFGRLSSSPAGAAAFAMRTGAAIFPIFVFREKNTNHCVEIEEPLVLPDASVPPAEAERVILQQFADLLETKIRKSPSQWLWAHRRWKSTPDRFVAVLSDGKAGHLNQSLALAEAFAAERAAMGIPRENTRVKQIRVLYKNKFFENLAKAVGAAHPFLLTPETAREIERTYADLVISCGSSLAGVNHFMKRQNAAKSAVVMKPAGPLGRFDAVIVPRHDGLNARENVFVTSAALSLKPAGGSFSLSKDKKHIGFLVGGDLPNGIAEAMSRAGEETGARLLVTSSRRTPAWAEALLKKTFGDRERCPVLVIANESNPPGAMGGILNQSDLFVVSGESVSMVSEAAALGRPVLVFLPSPRIKLKPKMRTFLNHLSEEGKIKIVTPETLPQAALRALDGASWNGNARGVSKDAETVKQAVRRIL
ncbi:MAG: mitochondrial fission ELM1 family protein [Candidatus Omnitrophica bacterium]|nr:mitochondrial fission ELM1 family protein [Candidatus Omnitrophota bacterium]